MNRRNSQLRIITEALRQPQPDVEEADLIYGYSAGYFEPGTPQRPAPWAMQVDMLARRIFTALFGRPEQVSAASPLEQAEQAKRRRDIVGEVGALMSGARSLEGAPWYPARLGDVLNIAFEGTPTMPAHGETYVVEQHLEFEGETQLRLLTHTAQDDSWVGHFAPGDSTDPLMEPWMEAGPHRLTLVRDGRVIHPARSMADLEVPFGELDRVVRGLRKTLAEARQLRDERDRARRIAVALEQETVELARRLGEAEQTTAVYGEYATGGVL